MKLLIALASFLVFAALAQTGGDVTAGGSGPAAAATIPLDHQLEYFRTDGRLAHLRAELAAANTEYEAAVKVVVKDCGEGSGPVLTQDGRHLFCVAQAPAAAAKK
ncbi:MAG TPA: hypothetical protein VGR63_02520 [Casimicrobiaceae bacterium]|jgi:hypothetical protein|nr:hypothetical protein [Casimicrobiaceae bacterium]